jgi:hypothetical protein
MHPINSVVMSKLFYACHILMLALTAVQTAPTSWLHKHICQWVTAADTNVVSFFSGAEIFPELTFYFEDP